MNNRKKIESALKEMGLKASKIEYQNCRSSWTYGDIAPSGVWSVTLEDGQFFESSPDCDTVSDAADALDKYSAVANQEPNESAQSLAAENAALRAVVRELREVLIELQPNVFISNNNEMHTIMRKVLTDTESLS